ncbi:TetR/AcrR family transcriptional regulator [Rhodococcus sp. NPDC056960]|uniref:TetR/AcrR family transcriptional regulator n=1 Tax=Rhodococcus sp. NPDC056960 TaxID=3345982 RepID=UPI00364110DD
MCAASNSPLSATDARHRTLRAWPEQNRTGRTAAGRWPSVATYAHSSISDICAHPGLSRRQFYEEFGSREEILLALYDLIQDEARDTVLAANEAARSRDPRVVAGTVTTAYIESVGTDERRARIVFVEVVGASPASSGTAASAGGSGRNSSRPSPARSTAASSTRPSDSRWCGSRSSAPSAIWRTTGATPPPAPVVPALPDADRGFYEPPADVVAAASPGEILAAREVHLANLSVLPVSVDASQLS